MAYKELYDYFPGVLEQTETGIFATISQITWFPGVDPTYLDTYFMLKNGEKLGSKMLEKFADTDGHITGQGLSILANIIHNKYIKNWEHEYKTLTVEYNPIENTDYVETYKGDSSADTTLTGGTTNENDVYGFNSSAAVHDSKGTTTFNNNKTESTGENSHEIRKHGNIGVTTNAQMISSDIDVWKLNNFYDILCRDICNVIALSIF